MSNSNWEADKMLDVYIYDYLVKKNLHATAKAFQSERKMSIEPVAIDAPGGFLFEWWSVFWDIFIAKTNKKHSDAAAAYLETQMIKAREQQQHLQPQTQQQQEQIQMQRLILQRQQQQQQPQQPQQQQHRERANLINGTANGLVGGDSLMQQGSGAANALVTKMYEERLKLPLQRDSLDDASMKQRFGEKLGHLFDASMTKSVVASGHPAGQVLHNSTGGMSGNLQQVQSRNPQLPGSTQDIKLEVNPVNSPRVAGPDGSLIGVPGLNQAGNDQTLNGWPVPPWMEHAMIEEMTGPEANGTWDLVHPPEGLSHLAFDDSRIYAFQVLMAGVNHGIMGYDQHRSGIMQQKPFVQSPQFQQQLQFFNPQNQHQILLHAQQSMASKSAGDVESRKLRMLLNNRNMLLENKDQQGVIGDVIANGGSPMNSGGPVMPRTDQDLLLKRIAQLQQQQQQQQQSISQQQQLQQPAISSQQSQGSNQNLHQQEKAGAASVTMDGSMSNSFRGTDQVSKTQNGRKRKQPVSSSGPANSSGTANTAGPSPSSAPSTPSTYTPGDVISMPSLQQSGNSTKPLIGFGSEGNVTLTSPSNQLAEMERFVEDGSLDDNVESFLSHDDVDLRETAGRRMDVSKGFTFKEAGAARASTNKVVCCHFSPDGNLLATGGHDKKAVLWHTDPLKRKSTLEEHSMLITDVRFGPSNSRLATSSFDKTVRVWDTDNPGYSLRTFTGHSAAVMSLDFHPNKEDLICSCDGDGEIRYWSINHGSCTKVFRGGTTRIRFQPRLGRYLAAASENTISIFDAETQVCRYPLQGHTKHVDSICWDPTGEYVASVSEDSVRVWSLSPGSEGDCMHKLSCSGNKFHSCVFHPTYQSLLIIGCYQSLELWDMSENKTMTLAGHEGLISSVAVSTVKGFVASASHDQFIKLWK